MKPWSAVFACLAVFVLSGCGGGDSGDRAIQEKSLAVEDPGPVHVHGLGINPQDQALFIATHTGLFRAGPEEETATRVGGNYQDTMGFTIVGPDRFLGSGHPDLRTDQPPFLGLISSGDAGESWQPISLHGKADFHVLESAGRRVVGYGSDFETRQTQLLVSDNKGRSWSERRAPMPLVDLALSPASADEWVAAGPRLMRTADGGRSWERLRGVGGLLAWSARQKLYRVRANGEVSVSADGGSTWTEAGSVGGQPAAFEAVGRDLYVALHDGVIKQSRDGGRTWSLRSRPKATTSSP